MELPRQKFPRLPIVPGTRPKKNTSTQHGQAAIGKVKVSSMHTGQRTGVQDFIRHPASSKQKARPLLQTVLLGGPGSAHHGQISITTAGP